MTETCKRKADDFSEESSTSPKDAKGASRKLKKPNYIQAKGKFISESNVLKVEKTEKTDWNDLKSKKKGLKAQRKKNKFKNLYDMTIEAKKLYEKLKCKTTQNKREICTQLHDIFVKADCYTKLVYSHDIARVVQCLLKYSPAEIRRNVSEKLLTNIVAMAKSRYAHFCVLRMLKYGTKDIRTRIIQAMLSNIIKLTTHQFSNEIIDVAYSQYATTTLKAQMRTKFSSELFKGVKDNGINKLSDAWKDSPTLKGAILSKTKANLLKCANKNLVDNSFVHAVLLDFLKVCKETERIEIIQAYTSLIAYLPSTKDGVDAAILIFLRASTKDRRALLKNLRDHVTKTCCHEFGYLLIITIINCTDDTVMLNKIMFATIMENVEEIVSNEWGRKVLAWMVAPEDTSFFHPQFTKEMNNFLSFSKKDKEVRQNEIVESILKPLMEKIANNSSFWMRSGSIALLTCAILKITQSYGSIAAVVAKSSWEVAVLEPENNEFEIKNQIPSIKIKKIKKSPLEAEENQAETENIMGIEHAGLHVALKKIIKQGRDKFARELAEKLTPETMSIWLQKNRGCFIVLTLIENSSEDVVSLFMQKIDRTLLTKQNSTGAKILLKKLI